MHTEGPREDPLVDMGYEIRDLNIPMIRKTTIGFFVFATLSFAVVMIWFRIANLNLDHVRENTRGIPKPPYPLLQTNLSTRADIMEVRQKETAVMTSRAQNPDGSWHIPVDQAIDLIVKRGLPETKGEVPAKTVGNTIKQNAVAPGEIPPTLTTPTPSR